VKLFEKGVHNVKAGHKYIDLPVYGNGWSAVYEKLHFRVVSVFKKTGLYPAELDIWACVDPALYSDGDSGIPCLA